MAAGNSTSIASPGRWASIAQQQLTFGDIAMHRVERPDLAAAVRSALSAPAGRPLALGSVNLDHVFHYSVGGASLGGPAEEPSVDWIMTVDGAPVARWASTATGVSWPRVTGADVLPDLLDVADESGAAVGFLGGSAQTADALRAVIGRRWPTLRLAGVWTPSRAIVEDPVASARLAAKIREHGVDLLIVGLGKPRQETWIVRHGPASGASVLAAFGAAAEFLAGVSSRAPVWMRNAGLEWSYRLVHEPGRLWRRYLRQGPVAMSAMRRATFRVEGGIEVVASAAGGNVSPGDVPVTPPVSPRITPRRGRARRGARPSRRS